MELPIVHGVVRWVRRILGGGDFPGSRRYWRARYASGGTSGPGSSGKLAEFKAEVLNAFVRENAVRSVIEHGCGDGTQLRLARYPRYLGLDVSPEALRSCRRIHAADATKEFRAVPDYAGERAELSLSLDVIFHLVEDNVFDRYMSRLFASAERFVVIYSSDTDEQPQGIAPHVRHRRFSRWVEAHAPGWRLRAHIANRHPFRGDEREGSFADFFVYEQTSA